jgi:hypothetical protein
LYITAVGITSPAASISSNTLLHLRYGHSCTTKDHRGVIRVDATVFLLLAQKLRYASPVLAQGLGVACFGLAAPLLRS